jgi:hypothetical protein
MDKVLDPEHRANISAGSTNKKWHLVHRVGWHVIVYNKASVESVRLQGQNQVASLTKTSVATVRRALKLEGPLKGVVSKIWVVKEQDGEDPPA